MYHHIVGIVLLPTDLTSSHPSIKNIHFGIINNYNIIILQSLEIILLYIYIYKLIDLNTTIIRFYLVWIIVVYTSIYTHHFTTKSNYNKS